MTTKTADGEQLSFTEKFSYALGDTASNLFWMTFIYFGTLFYTDVFGISAAATGTLMFAARILDTVFDPVVGMVADRTNTRWGKFRPYMLWGVLPFGLCGTLAFVTPPFGPDGKLLWAYLTYGLVGLVYSAINLPYSALMGVISPNSEERTKVSSFRFVGAYSGGLIVSLCTLFLVGALGGDDKQLGWAMTVGLYALVGMVMWLVCFANTKERVTPPANQSFNFDRDIKDVMDNRPWLVLFLLGIFSLGYQAIRNGCIAYYFKYYVGDQVVLGHSLSSGWMISAFFVTGSLATLFGTGFVAPVAKRIGKKLLYSIMMGLASVLTLSFYFLRPHDVLAMFVLQLVVNIIMGPTAALVFAMYADASDYSEWKTGRRSTGLVFAASSFAQKMGWALGGAATGWILAAFGYQANMRQTPESLNGMRMLISVIPAVLSLIATVLPFAYALSDKRMKEIERDLAERRTTGRGVSDVHEPFGGNPELREYALRASGLKRQTLNLVLAAGLAILVVVAVVLLGFQARGWYDAVGIVASFATVYWAFTRLGKAQRGGVYVAVMVGCVVAGLSEQFIGVVAIIVFVVAWIHANGVLSECRASVGPRLAEIELAAQTRPSADLWLEQGLLRSRVLLDESAAQKSVERALEQQGGDATLLNAAGVLMLGERSVQCAKQCFERAAMATSDKELLQEIRRNQALVNAMPAR
jgi:GPH family glycoside/pentoside/hexuronide:cation symporter